MILSIWFGILSCSSNNLLVYIYMYTYRYTACYYGNKKWKKNETHLLSEVENLQVSEIRSVSCTKWASCKDSSPNRSCKHSKFEMSEKLGNPARLKSLIHSQENLASKRIVPSRSGTVLALILCLKSWCDSKRRAMSSTWQTNPANAQKSIN